MSDIQYPEDNSRQIQIEICLPDVKKMNRELQLMKIIVFISDLPAMLRAAGVHCLHIFPMFMYSPVRTRYLCTISVDFATFSRRQLSDDEVEKINCGLMKHWQNSITPSFPPETF